MKKSLKSVKGFTLVEIMIVVAIIGILIAIAVPGFIRARINSRGRACQENLSKIDGAKEQYALEFNLNSSSGTQPAIGDLCATDGSKYIKAPAAGPTCPSGGAYTVNSIGTAPTCSVGTNESTTIPHALQ